MAKTIFQDKTMLFLVLVVAFFVGGAITGVFSDYEVEAKTTISDVKKLSTIAELFEQMIQMYDQYAEEVGVVSPEN